MNIDKTQTIQNLLNGTASEEDVELLKRLLASGEISIGGNVSQSVIIIGSGNTVELPPAALDRLNARPMLGNLDRDLTGEEIASGLRRLDKLLPNRAPVLLPHYKEQVGRLRPTLKTEVKTLSEPARREHVEALAAINSICVEALDVSFNGLALGEAAPDYDARSPFRGLESFRPEDSEFFFGREELIEKLVGKIKAHSFLAVLGASGSGKSSLVMAGVIPALDLDYVVFRPGTKPLDELESARGKSLIVVDQFEELFTLTRDESTRKEFIARLMDESSRARIILTLRSDFLGEVGAYRILSAEIQNHLEIVPPMDVDELHRAMEGQAGVTGLRFEADLSQQILDDVAGEPGAMPLLQHALWELWNRRHGRNLRASEYRAFGGVKQAISSTAEKVYAECSKTEQDALRDIFLRLTRVDESADGRDTRRRVLLRDLIPADSDPAATTLLIKQLADTRLAVVTGDEVEVAHEALIRHWERLRIWLNEDREGLLIYQHLSDSAHQWNSRGRDPGELYRGRRLAQAQEWTKKQSIAISPLEQAFLKKSHDKETLERRVTRLRWVSFTGAGLLVLLTIFLALTGQLNRFIYRPVDMDDYWVDIPAGEFWMGSEDGREDERPVHLVRLDAFQMGRYEVTNRQYIRCVQAGICGKPGNQKYESTEYVLNPVTDVSWYDAATFCNWINGRLPSEAEWEYAARGGLEGKHHPWGNEPPSCAWDAENGANYSCFDGDLPVGSYSPNYYGLFDMAGNVWEWTASWYSARYIIDQETDMPNPLISLEENRVLRGGSWGSNSGLLLVSTRTRNIPEGRSFYFGFRCARSMP
jgi:formylglycine-generating enzyme required for sulfatase activity/energy-coupling factor transporter ATP-binding protein EcfA2